MDTPLGRGLGALIPPSSRRGDDVAPVTPSFAKVSEDKPSEPLFSPLPKESELSPPPEELKLPPPPPEPVGPIVVVPPMIIHSAGGGSSSGGEASSEPQPAYVPPVVPSVSVAKDNWITPTAYERRPERESKSSFTSAGGGSSSGGKATEDKPSFASARGGSASGGEASSFTKVTEDKSQGKRGKMPEAIFQIETEKIHPNPDQPRRVFDEEQIRELAASIREFGLLQPIVVSKIEREVPTGTEVEYELISGERRLLAAKMLGLERIPAIVRNLSYDRERLELAVIENLQRENLNPIEMARAFARLQDEFRLTQREIASRLGKSREAIANTVRLLDLPPEIQESLQAGEISESHGRLLLTIDDPALQKRLFRDLLDNRLTTRELKNRAAKAQPEHAGRVTGGVSPELKSLEERLSSELGAPVSIKQHGESGRITINFYSPEELRGILERLGGDSEQ